MPVDYRTTVFLPQTSFPMKAELPKREPTILARWEQIGLASQLRDDARGREKFILHDGPPYANGNIHIGHALNKILKDIIVRSRQMQGRDSVYVPGWDCHGLPIEWKIEEKYRAEKKNKDEVPIVEFRQECRAFAAHWINVQREEFKRLGIGGDWENPYLTMNYGAEAQIAREIAKFAMNGGLFRGAKPVMWSVVEKTALAEAEVEYHDHTSRWVFVRFPVVKPSVPGLQGASAVIWTTTPWTLPANRAIAYGSDFEYAVIEVESIADGALALVGERILVAEALIGSLVAQTGISAWKTLTSINGAALRGTIAAHPLRGQGYEFDVPLLPAGHVTTEAGTGLVHIAPSHGEEDWEVGRAFGIEVAQTVDGDGSYFPHVPLFAGRRVYTAYGKTGDANGAVIDAIKAAGGLLSEGTLIHSYPHSWRSKAPLIYRTTPQWFISMETNDLRAKALAAIEETRWVPSQGRNRIYSMVESRPDWCVSRQRAWGVPIAVFVDKKSGELLRDIAVFERIADAFEAEGADAWYTSPPERFLGADRNPGDYEQVMDIADVWFDSGSTHAFVLEQRPELQWPASLYLEGSDQHRGWFHSSLLESCGTRGRAPYEAVLTHGFTLDEQGRKMSKSLGNGVAPQDVTDESGADVLRLWVVSTDYTDDQRIGKNILKYQIDVYRRFRNTLRYLLGAVAGFDEAERVAPNEMPELERWVLHRLSELDTIVREGVANFDFHAQYVALHSFCAVDLSAFYFDIRKDWLYCNRPDDSGRRAARTVMATLFDSLTTWLAPILCFTAEEAWLERYGQGPDISVHLQRYPVIPGDWSNPGLAARWEIVRDLRRVVTGAIELERAAKRLGSSLQANATVYVQPRHIAALEGLDVSEIAIVSNANLTLDDAPTDAFRLVDVGDIAVVIGLTEGEKCQRCWKILPEVVGADLCGRCEDAVAASSPPA